MKISYLSKKDIKQYSLQIMGWTGIQFEPVKSLELDNAIVLVGNGFIIYDKRKSAFYPFLADNISNRLPHLEVDDGAADRVKHGANVMRPGVIKIDERLRKARPALVVNNKQRIAIAISEMNYDEAMAAQKGVVAKNVHRQGDQAWNAIIEFIQKYYKDQKPSIDSRQNLAN